MTLIIDTPYNTTSKISCLLSNGVGTVIRYYNFSNSQTFPNKCLELPEAQALSRAGIEIATVFQQRQNQVDDFSKQQGINAGKRAYRHAFNSIGQPANSGIYFSVDFDASESDIKNSIIPYFEGVKESLKAEQGYGDCEYRVGVYGSGLVCNTLEDKGLATLKWLSMSTGFRGTKNSIKNKEYDLLQFAPAKTLCGIGVDYNEANPARPDFGTFRVDFDDFMPTAAKYKVIARNSLNVREGAGTQFDSIGGLKSGQIVHVIAVKDGWAKIDINGDGLVDGFASMDYLMPV